MYNLCVIIYSTTRPLPDGKKDIAPSANFFVYSGHDSTVVPLLCALGIYNGKLYQLYTCICYILLYCYISASVCQLNFPLYLTYLPLIFPLISDEWPPYATYVAIEIAEFIEDSYSDDEDSAPHRLGICILMLECIYMLE